MKAAKKKKDEEKEADKGATKKHVETKKKNKVNGKASKNGQLEEKNNCVAMHFNLQDWVKLWLWK